MTPRLRYKGQFIKEKTLSKRLKAISAMSQAKKEKKIRENVQSEATRIVSDLCEGRRIVEFKELGKNLKCCQCKQVLCLERIVNEKRYGLHSILSVLCDKCDVQTLVATGKMHSAVDNEAFKNHADVNTKAILGAVHAGIGSTALNKILACLNIPTISESLFKRYEREVGPAIEKSAKESCRRAAQEERRLVIENLDKLCQDL